MYCTELDLAEDEFFAEFEEKDEEPSVGNRAKKAPGQWRRLKMYSREGNEVLSPCHQ